MAKDKKPDDTVQDLLDEAASAFNKGFDALAKAYATAIKASANDTLKTGISAMDSAKGAIDKVSQKMWEFLKDLK